MSNNHFFPFFVNCLITLWFEVGAEPAGEERGQSPTLKFLKIKICTVNFLKIISIPPYNIENLKYTPTKNFENYILYHKF